MAAQAKRPRPGKNSDGQDKKPVPTMSHDISISPGKPQPAPAPPPAPGMPAPGTENPLTHPAHPVMQSQLGTQAPPHPMPGTPPAGPTEAPADNRQVQERISFKDLPPPAQNQVEQQQGIDPYAPIHAAQSSMEGALQQGPSQGPVPNAMMGPFLPPDVQSFPDDFAHLQTLMQQGFAPGSSHQEHQFALNAHALHNALANAQQGSGVPTQVPAAPPGPLVPPTPGPGGPGPMPGPMPGPAPAPGPGLGSSLGGAPAPPTQPGAPGGIPPQIIAALLAQHKRPVR